MCIYYVELLELTVTGNRHIDLLEKTWQLILGKCIFLAASFTSKRQELLHSSVHYPENLHELLHRCCYVPNADVLFSWLSSPEGSGRGGVSSSLPTVLSQTSEYVPWPLPHSLARHTETPTWGLPPQTKPHGQLVGHGTAACRRWFLKCVLFQFLLLANCSQHWPELACTLSVVPASTFQV